MLRWSLRRAGEVKEPTALDLDPYSVAYLNQGKILTVNAAITSLIDQKILVPDQAAKALVAKSELLADAHALEKSIYAVVAQPGGAEISDVRNAVRPVERIATQLQNEGLVVADSQARKALWWPLMLAAIAPTIGLVIVRFSRKSISDWKNEYMQECETCVRKVECGGFFSSAKLRYSAHMKPFHN